MSSATQLETYAKITPKQKGTTLAYLPSTKCYSGQLTLSLTTSYSMWGAYATSDMTLMSLHETYCVEESGHVGLASYIGT